MGGCTGARGHCTAGACDVAADPELDARAAHPLWLNAEEGLLHVRALRAHHATASAASGSRFDLWRIPCRKRLACAPDAILTVSIGAHHVRILLDAALADGAPFTCTVPLTSHLRGQLAAFQAIAGLLEGTSLPATPHPPVTRAGLLHLRARLTSLLTRCEQLRTQSRRGKDKVYAIHAPEVECISKGKARQRYEFGVKASLAVTHRSGLIVGARTFPGNPYDGHVLGQQLEQTTILLEDVGVVPNEVFVDLGYRGVDADNPGVRIVHRGRMKTLDDEDRQRLKRRQVIEPVIGHLKSDHRMARCWLKGAAGDALNAVLAAAGFNLRWLMRAVLAGRISAFLRALRLSTANGIGTAAAFITRILASTAAATAPSLWNADAETALVAA